MEIKNITKLPSDIGKKIYLQWYYPTVIKELMYNFRIEKKKDLYYVENIYFGNECYVLITVQKIKKYHNRDVLYKKIYTPNLIKLANRNMITLN